MKKSKHFWNKEYLRPAYLALSTEPASDLEKFTRWQERNYGREFLNPQTFVLDLGCGNGRNLIFLAREFGCRGVGYDISSEAIAQARTTAGNFFQVLGKASQPKAFLGSSETIPRTLEKSPVASLDFQVRQLNEKIPLADNSVNIVLDMMSSHVLKQQEREQLRNEIWRVLRPGGWLFFKSFLLEEDLNARRMLRDHPATESNSYIHPVLGIQEHVWTIDELEDFFTAQFEIRKIEKSHKHLKRPPLRQGFAGRNVPFRRRTVTIYLQKRD
jgi:SAM-dependent methyltransferase